MYAVRLNTDSSVTTVVNQRISVGYQAQDWFWFFLPPIFKGKSASECVVSIQYVTPQSKKTKTEVLIAKNEYYGENLKYALPKYSKLTNESGTVEIVIIYTDNESSVTSDKFTVGVSTDNDYHDDKTYDNPDLNPDDDYLDEFIEKVINLTKPLIFDSVENAITTVNSGDIKVYLGQNVIIIQNGKYLLYSIQQGTDGYIVDPVDTYGEGAIWTDDDETDDEPDVSGGSMIEEEGKL